MLIPILQKRSISRFNKPEVGLEQPVHHFLTSCKNGALRFSCGVFTVIHDKMRATRVLGGIRT